MVAGSKSNGFTLIEVMVVVVIIGLLAGILVPNVMRADTTSKKKLALAQMSSIATAVKMYKLENGRYPTTAQGLEALVVKTGIAPVPRVWPRGGYLPKVPTDPWKNTYVYVSPGIDRPFEIYSLGADAHVGGEGENKDLYSWKNG